MEKQLALLIYACMCVRARTCECLFVRECRFTDALACDCVRVALLMQYVNRMRSFMLISVACLAAPHFCTLSYARHDFLKLYWT